MRRILDPKANPNEIITAVHGIYLKRKVIRCLEPETWLNCETLDAYFLLLDARAKKFGQNVMILPTHFYNSTSEPKYSFANGLQYFHERNPLECDQVLIPMNQSGEHWVMMVVNIKKKLLQFFDPLAQLNSKKKEQQHIRRYFEELARQSNMGALNIPLWKDVDMDEFPKQLDNYNCGVYIIMYIEYLTGLDQEKSLNIDPTRLPWVEEQLVLDLFYKTTPSKGFV